jgi:predicted DNA-binding transcriptional regulator YafY
MADDTDIPRWNLKQRFEFIEWHAYWTGRVNRRNLEEHFGISTQQASIDFRRYQEAAPENIDYDASEKSYVATPSFRPQFLRLSPERYLRQLEAIRTKAIVKSETWFDELPPYATLPDINREPSAPTLRRILSAIDSGHALNINYASLSGKMVRKICPHALANDGYRWHVRALSFDHRDFRDYVLARVLSVGELEPCEVDPADDLEWQTECDLKLTAHPSLNADERAAVEQGFRFEGRELTIRTRLALAFYFIRRNDLDFRETDVPPQRTQLWLVNLEEIRTAIADAKQRTRQRLGGRMPSTQDRTS